MSTTLSTQDQLLYDVLFEYLASDPRFDATMVGVSADNAVTLTGYVATHAEKLAVERAVRVVFGPKAIVNALEVKRARQPIDPGIDR